MPQEKTQSGNRRRLGPFVAASALALLIGTLVRIDPPDTPQKRSDPAPPEQDQRPQVSIEPPAQGKAADFLELLRSGRQLEALEQLLALDPAASAGELPSTFREWAEQSPEQAEMLAELLRENDLLSRFFRPLAEGWAKSSPQGLAAFSRTLPTGQERTAGLDIALDEWILRDPDSALAWLPELQDSAEFDKYLFDYIRRTDTANRSSETAAHLALELQDPSLRLQSLEQAVIEWIHPDPEAALAFIAATQEIPLEQKELLLAACLDDSSKLGPLDFHP